MIPTVAKCVDNPQPDQTLYLPDDAGLAGTELSDAESPDTGPPDAGMPEAAALPSNEPFGTPNCQCDVPIQYVSVTHGTTTVVTTQPGPPPYNCESLGNDLACPMVANCVHQPVEAGLGRCIWSCSPGATDLSTLPPDGCGG
jgi:hypothetical protein